MFKHGEYVVNVTDTSIGIIRIGSIVRDAAKITIESYDTDEVIDAINQAHRLFKDNRAIKQDDSLPLYIKTIGLHQIKDLLADVKQDTDTAAEKWGIDKPTLENLLVVLSKA